MRSHKRPSPRLHVEQLEDRAVPATLYVATTGNNANPGTSSNPWQTLQYAADHVHAGDTVIVRAGNYAGFDLWTDGTATNRIVFSAEAGATITARNARTNDGINLEGADYITIDGFKVVGIGRAGIRSVLNTGVIIQNNNCDQNGVWGIFTGFSENILIQNNVTSRSVDQHGIYVSNSADNPIIRGNTVWGNHDSGIQLNADVTMGGDGIISNALIENNVIHDNGLGGGASINCDGVQNSVIRNNLIYNAHATGIVLYVFNGASGSSRNLVVNNTVLAAADGRWALLVANGSTGNKILNNILYSAQSYRGSMYFTADSLTGTVSDYNIVEDAFTPDDDASHLTLSQWRTVTGLDAHSLLTSNPANLFVNTAGEDYHLTSGSVAIDRGTSASAPLTDLYGTARPNGNGFDIGHAEYPASPPPPPPPPPSPPPPSSGAQPFAVGTSRGAVATVMMFNADRTTRFSVQPFGSSYSGGTRIAVGDVTGDGVADAVAVTSGRTPAQAHIIDGATGTVLGDSLIPGGNYTGAVSVAVGDVTGDGVDDIAIGTNGNGSRVRVYRGGNFVNLADFRSGSGIGFRGHTQVALADMTGDGKAELVVSGLYTTGTRLSGYDSESFAPGAMRAKAFKSFTLGSGYRNGLFLALGDVDGDGVADVVAGSANSAKPGVAVFSGQALIKENTPVKIAKFTPEGSRSSTGVHVAVRDINGDGTLDIVTSSGDLVSAFQGGAVFADSLTPSLLFAFDPDASVAGGVWVG